MINKFYIGNFKAFSDMQAVPLKPITIIFGPNSSGKSSVIHSLLLARHGVDTKSLDATYPSIAGHSVDLGGFRQYIHRHDFANHLRWSADIDVSSLPGSLPKDLAQASKLTVRLTAGIRLDDEGQPVAGAVPFTQSCEYYIDDDLFIRLTRTKQKGDFSLAQLNREHVFFEPILQAMLLSSRAQQNLKVEDSRLLAELIDSIVPKIKFSGESDFLPGIDFDSEVLSQMDSSISQSDDSGEFERLGDLGKSVRLFFPRMLMRFHSGVQEALTKSLKSLSYLGPLRSVPPRHMAFAEDEAFGHSAAGASAWKEIARNLEVRNKVNFWLGNKNRLKTPYRLELEPFHSEQEIIDLFESLHAKIVAWGLESLFISAPPLYSMLEQFHNKGEEYHEDFEKAVLDLINEYADLNENRSVAGKLMDKLRRISGDDSIDIRLYDIRKNTPVSHRDVGIGISQVLPVLVNAYASKNAIIAMEQPEIHLHPALQAELGDVFIESALGENKNRFILETHSEHLILRILRRIRETTKFRKNPESRPPSKGITLGEGDNEFEITGVVPRGIAFDGSAVYEEQSYKYLDQRPPDIRPDDIALIYVDTTGDSAEIINLRVDERGRLIDQCPGGFFEEDFEELF